MVLAYQDIVFEPEVHWCRLRLLHTCPQCQSKSQLLKKLVKIQISYKTLVMKLDVL